MRRIGGALVAIAALFAGCAKKNVSVAQPAVTDVEEHVQVATTKGPYIAEGLPEKLRVALDKVNATDATTVVTQGRSEFVIRRKRRWPCGEAVTVAFKGGSVALRTKIADATKDWTGIGNVKLDFGSAASGYRTWRPSDADYAADVRISFDHPEGGYWSLVGKDSNSAAIVEPGEASMNFEGFTTRLPRDWRGTVLHEFGHAVGFEHEHQHPKVACDFRWDDDPGYQRTTDEFGQFTIDSHGRRPGIYTVLGGPPNKWSRGIVDHNLRKLPNTRAFKSTPTVDKESIMKYFFEDWMFVDGTGSKCFSPTDNLTLSAKDKQGIAWAYPATCPQ